MSKTTEMAARARQATLDSGGATEEQRHAALESLAAALLEHQEEILAANALDLEAAETNQLSAALVDRLRLSPERIAAIAAGVREIAAQPRVVGQIVAEHRRDDGLRIKRQRIPLGVVGMIYESRPNVAVDGAALAVKSGNAIILKGGKEARHSNEVIGRVIRAAIDGHLPSELVQVLDSTDRGAMNELLTGTDLLDVIVPRGGEGLIRHVREHARVPVIAHDKGLCHTYVHKDADLQSAAAICLNAKVQRPGVCNAMETLLLDRSLPDSFVVELIRGFQDAGVEIRGEADLKALCGDIQPATEADWDEEYLDLILSVKRVDGVEAAISHIQQHGSHHSECILAQDPAVIATFMNRVDASAIMINSSTRFNDGGELGLGAELGISTSKMHAYGPMGAAEMTTMRFVVEGEGHCRQ